MKMKVLVAYASKHGATEEIAKQIGQILEHAGQSVEVSPANQVGDLAPYGAVVLGSAVYAGQWMSEAAEFLKANERPLAERRIWFFSSGPTGEGDPVELMKGWRFPESLQPVANRIRPRDIAFFGGELDPKKLSLPERLIVKGIKAPTGDFRNWDSIQAWAESIAQTLGEESGA